MESTPDVKTPADSLSVNPLANLTSSQREAWQRTGELPEPRPSKAESAPAQPSKGESASPEKAPKPEQPAAEPESEAVAGSEPAKQEAKPKGRVRERIEEVDSDIEELHDKLNQRAQLRKQIEAESGEKQTATPAEAQIKPDPNDPEPQKENFDEYEAYLDARADWKARQAVRKALEAAKEKQAREAEEAKVREEAQAVLDKWEKSKAEGIKKHPDFEAVALADDVPIKDGSVVHAFILESEVASELAYYLGQHRDELEAINKLRPIAQARALTKIELSLSEEPPAPKKVSSAPSPVRDIGGRAGAVEKDATAYVKDGFAAYKQAADAEDISSRKG